MGSELLKNLYIVLLGLSPLVIIVIVMFAQ